MPIEVKTPVYEGPLDLLLELIEKRKLLISDISLAQVTDEYIAKVNGMKELPVEETAEFIALAATLLLIKSRSLLPSLALSPEESHDVKELEYRLAIYQLVKEAARRIGRLSLQILYEGEVPEPEPLFIPDPSVTPSGLRGAAQRLIEGFPAVLVVPQAQVKRIMSLEEMIERMSRRVASAFRMSFKEFSGSLDAGQARHHIIVSFLALLELVKQGILKAEQEGGDIIFESDTVSTPTYGKED